MSRLTNKERARRAALADESFGLDPSSGEIPPVDFGVAAPEKQGSKPPKALIALGPPPADAAAIQKWNYQALTIMAWEVMKDRTISQEQRMVRAAKLQTAAAKHYPEAARYDLSKKIDADKADRDQRKARNKAGAKLEAAPPAGSAKVIPIRRDG